MILIPFFLGLIIAYLVHPLTDRFVVVGLRRDRVVMVLYVFLLGFAIAAAMIFLPILVREAQTTIQEFPTYAASFDRTVTHVNEDVRRFLGRFLGKRADLFTIHFKADQLFELILDQIPQNLANVAHFGLWMLIIPFVCFFGLSHGPKWIDAIFDLTPSEYVESLLGLFAEVNATLGAYIRGQILDAMCVGLLTMVGLWGLGFQGAAIMGLVTGLLNVIPFAAPIAGGGLTLLFAYIQGLNWATLFGILCLFALVRLIDDFVLMPFIVGRVVHLHPVLMLFGILAGYSAGGVFGLIFAIPIMAVLKIVLSSVLLNRRETRIFQNQKMMS